MFNIEDFNRHVIKTNVAGLVSYKCAKGSWVVELQESNVASLEAYKHFQKHFIDGEYHANLKEVPMLDRFINWIRS